MAAGLTCVESEELLALAALGVLGQDEGAVLAAHLATCDACRATGAGFQRAAAALPGSVEPVDAPASLRRKLLAEVYAGDARRTRPSWWASLWSRIPQARALTLAGALAALVAVAFGVWGATRTSAPGAVHYDVVATTSEPAARGTLTYFPGNELAVLAVSGLPQPPTRLPAAPGVYELWLVPASGAPIPAAFLAESPTTHAWSATVHADITRYAAVAVTAEPWGGSPQPTGPQLFSVPLIH